MTYFSRCRVAGGEAVEEKGSRFVTSDREGEVMAARVIPLHCIIPPHMLREIARRGDPDQQAWAFGTLSLSEQLRGQRQVLGLWAPATPAGANPHYS